MAAPVGVTCSLHDTSHLLPPPADQRVVQLCKAAAVAVETSQQSAAEFRAAAATRHLLWPPPPDTHYSQFRTASSFTLPRSSGLARKQSWRSQPLIASKNSFLWCCRQIFKRPTVVNRESWPLARRDVFDILAWFVYILSLPKNISHQGIRKKCTKVIMFHLGGGGGAPPKKYLDSIILVDLLWDGGRKKILSFY